MSIEYEHVHVQDLQLAGHNESRLVRVNCALLLEQGCRGLIRVEEHETLAEDVDVHGITWEVRVSYSLRSNHVTNAHHMSLPTLNM